MSPAHKSLALRIDVQRFPLKEPFRITGHTMVHTDVVKVTLERDGACGHGEASGVYYRGDDVAHIVSSIEAARSRIEAGVNRESLQQVLPIGGARNAVDCALWDLESKLAGKAAWQLAKIDPPHPLITTFTVSAKNPEQMAVDARDYSHARAIKLKLTGQQEDAARVRAVREVRPDVWLGVDANQGFTRASLQALMPVLLECWCCPYRAALRRRTRGGARWSTLPHSSGCRRKRTGHCRLAEARRPIRCRQHQARQMRRPDGGAGNGSRRREARSRRDGGQHAGHLPRHGPILCPRSIVRHR